jgi:diketogulonate reductase-like aldo/keto reductase
MENTITLTTNMTQNTSITTMFHFGGDLSVNRLGYGAMRLSGQPGNFGRYPDWEAGQQLLRRAAELGVNFIDTAEAYGPGFNEELIASALHSYSLRPKAEFINLLLIIFKRMVAQRLSAKAVKQVYDGYRLIRLICINCIALTQRFP